MAKDEGGNGCLWIVVIGLIFLVLNMGDHIKRIEKHLNLPPLKADSR